MIVSRTSDGKIAAVFKETDTLVEIASYTHCTSSELLACLNKFIDKREQEIKESQNIKGTSSEKSR